jgi:hypothetical protein
MYISGGNKINYNGCTYLTQTTYKLNKFSLSLIPESMPISILSLITTPYPTNTKLIYDNIMVVIKLD